MQSFLDRLVTGGQLAAAGGDYKIVSTGTIGTQCAGQNAAWRFAAADYHCPGAITKEHTRLSVVPVHNARKSLGADDQYVAAGAGPNRVGSQR